MSAVVDEQPELSGFRSRSIGIVSVKEAKGVAISAHGKAGNLKRLVLVPLEDLCEQGPEWNPKLVIPFSRDSDLQTLDLPVVAHV